jgi:hypothetical protein
MCCDSIKPGLGDGLLSPLEVQQFSVTTPLVVIPVQVPTSIGELGTDLEQICLIIHDQLGLLAHEILHQLLIISDVPDQVHDVSLDGEEVLPTIPLFVCGWQSDTGVSYHLEKGPILNWIIEFYPSEHINTL